MMLDVILGGGAVLFSLTISLLAIRLLHDRPVADRGMVGLAATVAHLLLSLGLPGVFWILRKPVSPLAFISSVLVFYWLSLIILVVAIIRWLRGAAAGAAVHSESGTDSNFRQQKTL